MNQHSPENFRPSTEASQHAAVQATLSRIGGVATNALEVEGRNNTANDTELNPNYFKIKNRLVELNPHVAISEPKEEVLEPQQSSVNVHVGEFGKPRSNEKLSTRDDRLKRKLKAGRRLAMRSDLRRVA